MRLLFFIFCMPLFILAQNSFEKELFPRLTQLDKVSPTETRFLDANGKIIGIRRISEKDTIYLDKMHRRLKLIPVVEKINPEQKELIQQVGTNEDAAIDDVVIGSVKDGKQPYIVRRRNRVIYFNGDGTRDMVVRQRRDGKKVTYRDGQRKLLGYKRRSADGITTYFDNKRRKTGQSFLSANGKLIFEPYRNRVTPSFMFKEIFISY